ncbi:FAD-dependent oxidoreductase [Microbacterium sp. GXS0129]|uniref:flavin monoamine oxidase family protein n=1 Tax=Microbacterium sp. GXS0129 TaxID=3377836 RepID=UPI00383A00AF
MRITRRTLLVSAGAGVLGVLLASCTPEPAPSPTPDPSSTTPAPEPTAPSSLEPSAFVRSAWSEDPFSLGAASFTPVGVQQSARTALAAPVIDRLFFAGEATDEQAPGTMSAAVRSGISAAEALLAASANGDRVAIVGAGLAGAAATARLASSGLELTVFEARDRVGGRVQSHVDDDEWPVSAQLGGWLVDDALDAVIDRPASLDLRTAVLSGALWRSTEGDDVEPVSAKPLTEAITAAQSRVTDESLTEALTEGGADPDDAALQALLAYLSTMSGADADQASSWFPPVLPPIERTAVLGDLAALFEELLDGAKVSVSSPVSRIAYDDDGVSLGVATGESLSFDRVLVTVPLGVLKTDGIEFSPALPFAHRGAIADLGMGLIETVWLRFDEPVIETDASLWHVVGGDATIRTWLNLAPATGENILVGLVGGAAAGEFAKLDDDAAKAAALASLTPFLGSTQSPAA